MKFPCHAIVHLLLPRYAIASGSGRGSSGRGSSPICDMSEQSPYCNDFRNDVEDAARQLKEKEDELVKKMCLPVDVFVPLLQGEGVVDKKSDEQLLKFPDVHKLAEKYYKHWTSKLKLDGLDQNKSRCVAKIVAVLVSLRRHVDVYQVCNELKQYASDGVAKMYILTNDDMCGQEILTRQVLTKWCTLSIKKTDNRNPSVAIRAMAAFCLPKHRGAMSHYLSGKWYRGDLDQCLPTDKALAAAVLEDFEDKELAVRRPDYMDHADHDPERKIDPHNCAYEGRDAVWLLETWTKYVKPKLKKALTNWYKETGGGNRNPDNFVNYCGGDKWLAWIYALDVASDFVLSSVAAGTPPSFVRLEAGFEDDGFDGSPSSFETPKQDARGRKADLEAAMKDGSNNLSSLLSVLKDSMEKRKGLNHLDAINKIREHKRALEDDDDFDDEMKKSMLESMKRMKHAYAKEMIEGSNN